MSKLAEAWSEGVITGNAGRKQILDRLAYRANHPHWICWPSNADLERTTEQKRSTVRGNLKALEDGGFIIRIQRRRQNGTMQTAAIVLLGKPLPEIVAEVEAIEKPHYVVADVLQDLKKLIEEQSPAPDFSAGQETAENGQSETSAKIHHPVESAQPAPESDPLELKENIKTTPQRPPKGGFSLEDKIDGFEPGEALLDDLVANGFGPADFIVSLVPMWRRWVVDSGKRIKSAPSSFTRWLKARPDIKHLRQVWWRQSRPSADAAPPVDVTDESVFASDAGRHALSNLVGRQFQMDCERQGILLGRDHVDQLAAARDAKHAKPQDDIEARCNRISAEKEQTLADLWLNKTGAAACR